MSGHDRQGPELAWLTVGGSLFGHPNGRDWTLRGFLSAKPAYGGLGLAVPQDEATKSALASAAPKLFDKPLAELGGRQLDAPYLNNLLVPDLAEDMLAWLGGSLTPATDPARFSAFQARAKAELKIDTAKVLPSVAAPKLLRQEDGWEPIWDRFAKGGQGFHENVAAILAPIDPPDLFKADPVIYATVNARAEDELRAALYKLKDVPEDAARDEVIQLAQEHASRCNGPWAARGQARLAHAIGHLGKLATTAALPANNAVALAEAYAKGGWQADDAVIRALDAVAPRPDSAAISHLVEDRNAVVTAIRAIYAPRLEREASTLQALLNAGMPASQTPASSDAVLFVDGLRMDLGHRLAALLRDQGAVVELGWRWTGLPSVTATCKPLASPAAGRLRAAPSAEGFEPLAADGKRADHHVLMRELAALGWRREMTLVPDERCWIETGHFDKDGHDQQSRMADGIAAALSAVAAQALSLAHSGRRLRIATDHGWLLLPGKLPVAKLPTGLTETKWGRCALIKDGASATATQLPWTWNPVVPIALAPGIHVFMNGNEYAHGGISPQESIVPELIVLPLTAPRRAVISDVNWSGLRMRVRADGGDGLTADLKLGEDGEGLSIADKPTELDASGATSLLVADDLHVGKPAVLVLRAGDGHVIASRKVVVGE